MLELRNIAEVLSGVSFSPLPGRKAQFVRLADLSDLRTGRTPHLAAGAPPDVARALAIEEDDLIIGARGDRTECFLASGSLIGAYISLDLYLIRPDHAAVDARYLRSFLNLPSTQARLAASRQGSDLGLARLPKKTLESVELIVPPLEVQATVARLADTAEQEQRLLARLAEKKALLNQEIIGRAIRSVSEKPIRRAAP